MTKGQKIEFKCVKDKCEGIITFLVNSMKKDPVLRCGKCGNEYKFDKELVSRLEMFENLVKAVNEAKPILGDTNVAINLAGHNIKVPFRLLLTRLSTVLSLRMAGKTIDFLFRVEPLKEEDLRKWGG